MTMQEQCALEAEMLEHFGLVREYEHTTRTVDGVTTTRRERVTDDMLAVNKALAISQAFLSLAEAEDAPIDRDEMILAIRYKMGYGWWAWIFVKHFAIPIIKWLWKRYHTDRPIRDLGAAVVATLGGVGACSPEHYQHALEQIAQMSGRTVDDAFRAEVTVILRSLPCPLD
jgi:hypothetical protein